ncbi:alcohol oxidase [Rickenella mellea]|uniref:Alcohol oxidase n=1 Tax=Rickenella mellea TaxID=50990 RepID=A0A4Y7PNP2_9AGAM|nr:alcohol oxidase [Rickenella mellea]
MRSSFILALTLSLLKRASAATSTTFDHIIVGGGAAGLVLAEKLSRNSSVSVLVLEAGFTTDDVVPALFSTFIGNPTIDWEFVTVPQPHVSNNVISLPRGKALGGTAAVNGMYFVRAASKEYDAWENLGNPGWNWKTVDANIKAMENFTPASPSDAATFHATDIPQNHGTNGPISVTYSNYWEPNPLIPAYFNTSNALGIPTNTHASGGSTFGVWQSPCAIDAKNRSRSYAVNTILPAAEKRPNLVVMTGAQVTKITLLPGTVSSGNVRAGGVQYLTNNATQNVNVTATGNVILTAGTYQTPKLLELSGIGNSAVLNKFGITPRVDLPGVGENLQDHFATSVSFQLKDGLGPEVGQLTVNSTFFAEQFQLYLTKREGPFASVPGTTLAMIPFQTFINATRLTSLKASLDKSLKAFKGTPFEEQFATQRNFIEDPSVPQIELVMLPLNQDASVTVDPTKLYMTIAAVYMHPFARGNVHIASTDPLQNPLIDPNYLGITEFETGIMVEAVRFVTDKMATTKPLSDLIVKTFNPAPGSSDAVLQKFVQSTLQSSWHPCGSASMLPKAQGGVVDPNLKVYGTDNIRVADASMIPLEIGTHTMATVYANALHAADVI